MASLFDIANSYIKKGFSVVPINHKMKRPYMSNWQKDCSKEPSQIKKWFENSKGNIGIVTGKKSNIWVLDIDGAIGQKSMYKILEQYKQTLELTLSAKTGGGGFHMFWEYDDRISGNRAGIFPNIDIRADGGQVVVYPSIHPNGNQYKWVEETKQVGIKKAPEWLIKAMLVGDKGIAENTVAIVGDIIKGKRNDTLYRVACKFVNDGFSKKMLQESIHIANMERCQPNLPKKEVDAIIKQALKYKATKDFISTNMTLRMPKSFESLIISSKKKGNQKFEDSMNRTESILGYKLGIQFEKLESAMEGIQKGMYLIGAISNVGKTSFLLNLSKSLIEKNKDLTIIFYTLDDSFAIIYYRLLSMFSGFSINQCSNIGGRMDKWEKETVSNAKVELDIFLERFIILDDTVGKSFEYIEQTTSDATEKYPDVMILIDNFHKIKGHGNLQPRDKYTKLSDQLKTLTNKLNITSFSTVELRKLNHQGAPTPDDMKDAVAMHYDSQVIFMLHSDSERNPESQKKVGMNGKEYPIIDLTIVKNKLSPFKKKIEYVFIPEKVDYHEYVPTTYGGNYDQN